MTASVSCYLELPGGLAFSDNTSDDDVRKGNPIIEAEITFMFTVIQKKYQMKY